jgi:hypothetical protein
MTDLVRRKYSDRIKDSRDAAQPIGYAAICETSVVAEDLARGQYGTIQPGSSGQPRCESPV